MSNFPQQRNFRGNFNQIYILSSHLKVMPMQMIYQKLTETMVYNFLSMNILNGNNIWTVHIYNEHCFTSTDSSPIIN